MSRKRKKAGSPDAEVTSDNLEAVPEDILAEGSGPVQAVAHVAIPTDDQEPDPPVRTKRKPKRSSRDANAELIEAVAEDMVVEGEAEAVIAADSIEARATAAVERARNKRKKADIEPETIDAEVAPDAQALAEAAERVTKPSRRRKSKVEDLTEDALETADLSADPDTAANDAAPTASEEDIAANGSTKRSKRRGKRATVDATVDATDATDATDLTDATDATDATDDARDLSSDAGDPADVDRELVEAETSEEAGEQLAAGGESSSDPSEADGAASTEGDGSADGTAVADGESSGDGSVDAAADGDGEGDVAATLPTSAAALEPEQLKQLVEALVFASDKPMTVQRLRQLTRVSDIPRLETALVELAADYADRGIVLQQVSGGYQFRTRTQWSPWVQQLIAGRPVRLTRAQLETLAIIAYRQPITRPEIDDIRGVDSSATLKLLIDRQLIRILGKKEEVGRPMLYGTTKEFLDFFSLGDLRELPTLREYSELTAESRQVITDRLGDLPEGADGTGEAPVEMTVDAVTDDAAAPAEPTAADLIARYVAEQDADAAGDSSIGALLDRSESTSPEMLADDAATLADAILAMDPPTDALTTLGVIDSATPEADLASAALASDAEELADAILATATFEDLAFDLSDAESDADAMAAPTEVSEGSLAELDPFALALVASMDPEARGPSDDEPSIDLSAVEARGDADAATAIAASHDVALAVQVSDVESAASLDAASDAQAPDVELAESLAASDVESAASLDAASDAQVPDVQLAESLDAASDAQLPDVELADSLATSDVELAESLDVASDAQVSNVELAESLDSPSDAELSASPGAELSASPGAEASPGSEHSLASGGELAEQVPSRDNDQYEADDHVVDAILAEGSGGLAAEAESALATIDGDASPDTVLVATEAADPDRSETASDTDVVAGAEPSTDDPAHPDDPAGSDDGVDPVE